MKQAYLLLTHNQPGYTVDLVKLLAVGNNQVYVHVDAKTDVHKFDELRKIKQCIILEDRERVFWCGYSTIKATNKLIHEALKDLSIERLTLISGACFPLKKADEIDQFFKQNPYDFINYDKRFPIKEGHQFYDRFSRFHLMDDEVITPRSGPKFKETRHYVNQFLSTYGKRALPQDYKIYVGSQWWSLRRNTISQIQQLRKSIPFDQNFDFTWCPDESYYHSIIGKLIEEGELNEGEVKPYLHYVNWEQEGKLPGLPKVLDESDFEVVAKSGKLFARKFDSKVSNKLRNKIKKNMLGINLKPLIPVRNEYPKALFLLSHMRGYTSLFSHILGSNPQIEGHVEKHNSYPGTASLNLSGGLDGKRYRFDKLLHNPYNIHPELVKKGWVKLIVTIRKPEPTIKSIVNMGQKLLQEENWFKNPHLATKYYIERLQYISQFLKLVNHNGLFFLAEDLVNSPNDLLPRLSKELQLTENLTKEYKRFEDTGKPGLGDMSNYINEGKIVTKRQRNDEVEIDSNLIEKAQIAYDETISKLINAPNITTLSSSILGKPQ